MIMIVMIIRTKKTVVSISIFDCDDVYNIEPACNVVTGHNTSIRSFLIDISLFFLPLFPILLHSIQVVGYLFYISKIQLTRETSCF